MTRQKLCIIYENPCREKKTYVPGLKGMWEGESRQKFVLKSSGTKSRSVFFTWWELKVVCDAPCSFAEIDEQKKALMRTTAVYTRHQFRLQPLNRALCMIDVRAEKFTLRPSYVLKLLLRILQDLIARYISTFTISRYTKSLYHAIYNDFGVFLNIG